MRRVGLLAAAVAVAAIAFPAAGAAVTKTVRLDADERYRGYTVTIKAMKHEEGPVTVGVILRNGTQAHRYQFDARRRALSFSRNLGSGTIELAALSGRSSRQLAARVGYGGGTITFGATHASREQTCSGGRSTTTRRQTRTHGQLRFSPTRKDEDEFVRSAWSGVAKRLDLGGCVPPPTCPKARRLSAYETDGATFGIVVWRYAAGGPLKIESNLFESDPEGPSVFEVHTRVARADRSRFEVTRLSHGSVNLEGVPGFSGSFEVQGAGDPFEHYAPCAGKLREGTATGDAGATFAFAFDQSPSSWTGGMITRGRL